ncbi:hypothetical protein ACNS7O_17260 (plasmid) [Haloferacaceae archaeon DSL9]
MSTIAGTSRPVRIILFTRPSARPLSTAPAGPGFASLRRRFDGVYDRAARSINPEDDAEQRRRRLSGDRDDGRDDRENRDAEYREDGSLGSPGSVGHLPPIGDPPKASFDLARSLPGDTHHELGVEPPAPAV